MKEVVERSRGKKLIWNLERVDNEELRNCKAALLSSFLQFIQCNIDESQNVFTLEYQNLFIVTEGELRSAGLLYWF